MHTGFRSPSIRRNILVFLSEMWQHYKSTFDLIQYGGCALKRCLIKSCVMVLLVLAGSATAGVDDFEDTGPNFTQVNSRVVEGITATISNASGLPYLAVTYFDEGSHCFVGAGDLVNSPVDPLRVSGDRFISTADDINADMPIVFEFSTPLGLFDLTTLDVLEDVETSVDAEVRLQGYNGNTLVAEHVISGITKDAIVSGVAEQVIVTFVTADDVIAV